MLHDDHESTVQISDILGEKKLNHFKQSIKCFPSSHALLPIAAGFNLWHNTAIPNYTTYSAVLWPHEIQEAKNNFIYQHPY